VYSNARFLENIDPSEILRHFGFSDFFTEGGQDTASDIQGKMTLDFIEAVNGCEKDYEFVSDVQCKTCSGSGAKPGTSKTRCKTCNGSGMSVVSNGLFQFQSACRSCGGEGEIISHPCTTCRGQGTSKYDNVFDANV
jgi:DnaJ-class molecular chaperone